MDNTKTLRLVTTDSNGAVSSGPLIRADIANMLAEHLNARFGDGTHLAVSAEDAQKIEKGELAPPKQLARETYQLRDRMTPAQIVSTGIKFDFSSIDDVVGAVESVRRGAAPAMSLYDGLVSSSIGGFPSLAGGPSQFISVLEMSDNARKFSQVVWADDPEATAKELGLSIPNVGELAALVRSRLTNPGVPEGRPAISDSAKALIKEALDLKFVEPASEVGPAHILPARVPAPKTDSAPEEDASPAAKPRSATGYGVARLGEDKKKASDVKPK